MARLRSKHLIKSQKVPMGLTLIEVLVALMIIAIALTAIIKAESQAIRGTTYLQDKMLATWVARDVITQSQLGILPSEWVGAHKKTLVQFGREWYVTLTQGESANADIDQLTVEVFSRMDEDATPLSHLIGYAAHEDT